MPRDSKPGRNVRARIADIAARLISSDGVDDFALAKRKAARQIGVTDNRNLPTNEEIEAALDVYRQLYQVDEHPLRITSPQLVASADRFWLTDESGIGGKGQCGKSGSRRRACC